MQINSVDSHLIAFSMTVPVVAVDPADKSMLVFHRYGEEYFLREVWAAGAGTGRELIKSHTEREIARKTHDAVGVVQVGATNARLAAAYSSR